MRDLAAVLAGDLPRRGGAADDTLRGAVVATQSGLDRPVEARIVQGADRAQQRRVAPHASPLYERTDRALGQRGAARPGGVGPGTKVTRSPGRSGMASIATCSNLTK